MTEEPYERFVLQLLIMIASGPGSVLGFRDIAVFNVDMLPASKELTQGTCKEADQ